MLIIGDYFYCKNMFLHYLRAERWLAFVQENVPR